MTLVPGWVITCDCEPCNPTEASIDVRGLRGRVRGRHSIIGAIHVTEDEVRAEPIEIDVRDSIVDAPTVEHPAIETQRAGGAPVTGALDITESNDANLGSLDLEDGIQVQFDPLPAGARYLTGDYWTIPARTSTGGIEWPAAVGVAVALLPRGIQHRYAPLAMMSAGTVGPLIGEYYNDHQYGAVTS